MKNFAIHCKSSHIFLAAVLLCFSTASLRAQGSKSFAATTIKPDQSDTTWSQPEFFPTPDLIIVSLPQEVPTQLLVGSPAVVRTTIRNVGDRRAGFSVLGYYLSADATLSNDDVLLGETVTAAIPADSALTLSAAVVVPPGTAAGTYYLLGVTDYLNLVREGNEGNNVWAQQLAVAPPSAAPARAAQPQQVVNTHLIKQQATEELPGFDLSLAPNPVARTVPVRVRLSTTGPQAAVALALYTSQGQRLATQTLTLLPGQPGQTEFSTANLATGVYVLYLSGPGLHAVRRVVVE